MAAVRTAPAPARAPAKTAASKTSPRRNPDVDFARGVAVTLVVIMLMAPAIEYIPRWLRPSAFAGGTLGDLLPAVFATIAGVALAHQVRARGARSWVWWVGRLTRRIVVLVVLGVGLAWLTAGPTLPVDLTMLRWTDHLVRIGVASVLAMPLVRLPHWGQVTVVTTILGASHALSSVDAVGLTTLAPMLVAVMVGAWVGEWLADRDRGPTTAGALLLLAAGAGAVAWSWNLVVPANATLWTGPIAAGGVSVTLALLALGHLGTRWSQTDRLVATATVLGQLALPVWVVTVLLGRYAATLEPWRWLVVDGLGPLLTPSGATVVTGMAIAYGLVRIGDRLLARGLNLHA